MDCQPHRNILGWLQMNVDDCIKSYERFMGNVFHQGFITSGPSSIPVVGKWIGDKASAARTGAKTAFGVAKRDAGESGEGRKGPSQRGSQ